MIGELSSRHFLILQRSDDTGRSSVNEPDVCPEPGRAASSDGNREEHSSFTGQKAEPLGVKFTLFLSGQEKMGKPCVLQVLKEKKSNNI